LALTLESRRVGDVTVMKCGGRIVEGDESAPLVQATARLLPDDPYIVLDLGAVDFVDSGGLGLLVRLRSRAQNAGGDVKLCALPPRIVEILRVTRLQSIFDTHPSDAEAVAAFYRDGGSAASSPDRLATDILCVAPSLDVIAYLREVLRQAGHGVMTSDNLPDALMLLRATRPRVIVMSAELAGANSRAADAFREMTANLPVVELPPDFSHRDAGTAARRLLDQVVEAMLRS